MHNELLHIGPLTVYGYGFMIAMGVLAAWFVAEQRARKLKLACEHIFYLVVWCAIGGFASAKILFWITNWREFLQNPRQIIGSDGFVVYGGIIGGILVGWLYCRIKKLKFLEYFDLMMPSIALAQGFGRIGCFLAGCCYLAVTEGTVKVKSAKLVDWLKKDGRTNSSAVVEGGTSGAKKAILSYEVLETWKNKEDAQDCGERNLIRIDLDTGRHHQIRVQMAHAGMPLVGDRKYNPGQNSQEPLALCSAKLGFQHPVTKKQLEFQVQPAGMAFKRH